MCFVAVEPLLSNRTIRSHEFKGAVGAGRISITESGKRHYQPIDPAAGSRSLMISGENHGCEGGPPTPRRSRDAHPRVVA